MRRFIGRGRRGKPRGRQAGTATVVTTSYIHTPTTQRNIKHGGVERHGQKGRACYPRPGCCTDSYRTLSRTWRKRVLNVKWYIRVFQVHTESFVLFRSAPTRFPRYLSSSALLEHENRPQLSPTVVVRISSHLLSAPHPGGR